MNDSAGGISCSTSLRSPEPQSVSALPGNDQGRIGKEKCWCGHKGCHDWWLTGIGKFCQGSGFSEEEADRIIAALNGELA